ncbi:MAG: peptidoglycan DD-metalloendopeptidase family protein [Patescibacteria group bacterium]
MAKNKNIINRSKQISVYMTVFIMLAVFLISSLPLIAQEVNGSANSNLNRSNNNDNTNSTVVSAPEETGNLSSEISEKRKAIDELNQQSRVYQENISQKQKEKASLNNEIYLLNNQISLANLEITKKQTEIEQLQLEIEKTKSEIKEKEDEINQRKSRIAEFLRIIYKNGQKSYLEIVLLNDSFSDFFGQIKYTNEIQSEIKKDLDEFVVLKHDLEVKEEDLSGKKTELDDTKEVLVRQKTDLGQQVDYQNILLDQTLSSESEYQALLAELTKQQQAVEAEVSSLEKRMRAKLASEKGETYYGEFSGTFVWPVDSQVVTCGFHCDGYPYQRWLGSHPAMDISTSQGSPVYAAADGYVAIARKLDWVTDASGRKRSAYNYVSIIHNDTLSTVYGHLSRINVSEGDFVTKGQVIGASGGLPGTAGAGVFSTGAHLHFEVRKVNESGIPIPVDPATYLY